MASKDGFARFDDAGSTDLGESFNQSAQMSAAFEAELGRLREAMTYTGREVGQLSSGLSGALRRAFEGVAIDGARLSDALKGVARSLADTAFSIAMRPIEQALSGAITQGMSGMMAGALPFAKGGSFAQGRVMAFAQGGVVTQPTTFPMRGATGLMGEAGPEAIMPLSRGADGRLGVASSGGGRPVNVTINVTTPDVAGFSRSQSQIAAQMGRLLARGDRNG